MMRWPRSIIVVAFALPLLSACDKPANTHEAPTPRAPVAEADTVAPTVEFTSIAGLDFALTTNQDKCALVSPAQKQQVLNLPNTCDFHKLETGEVQVETGHHGPVFLVASSVPNPGPEDYEKNDCDTRIIAITIKDSETFVQKNPNKSASCLDNSRLDNIYFLAPSFVGLK